jgi:hypothetical protein
MSGFSFVGTPFEMAAGERPMRPRLQTDILT